jgi:hypothetical protein
MRNQNHKHFWFGGLGSIIQGPLLLGVLELLVALMLTPALAALLVLFGLFRVFPRALRSPFYLNPAKVLCVRVLSPFRRIRYERFFVGLCRRFRVSSPVYQLVLRMRFDAGSAFALGRALCWKQVR